MSAGIAAPRCRGIDAARWLLCFPVALLHSLPRPDIGHPPTSAILIAVVCRVAVPFFFVTSGYFAQAGNPLAVIKRLAPVYLAWLIIYSLADHQLAQLLHPGTWLTGGSAIHLWFIPALMIALIIVPNLVERAGLMVTGLLCLLSALGSLAFDAYRLILHLPVIGGTRLMIAAFLVYVGILFRRTGVTISPAVALLVFAMACAAAAGEELGIAYLSGAPLVSHAFVSATLVMGPALFLFARGIGRVPAAAADLGMISLGVYAAHLLFVRLFLSQFGPGGLMMQIAAGTAAVLAATALSILLSRTWARWLVQPARASRPPKVGEVTARLP